MSFLSNAWFILRKTKLVWWLWDLLVSRKTSHLTMEKNLNSCNYYSCLQLLISFSVYFCFVVIFYFIILKKRFLSEIYANFISIWWMCRNAIKYADMFVIYYSFGYHFARSLAGWNGWQQHIWLCPSRRSRWSCRAVGAFANGTFARHGVTFFVRRWNDARDNESRW